MKSIMISTMVFGTPNVLAGGSVGFNLTTPSSDTIATVVYQTAVAQQSMGPFRDAILAVLNATGKMTALPFSSNIAVVVAEIGDEATANMYISLTSAGSTSGITVYPTAVVSMPVVSAVVENALAGRSVAEANATAANAALLVALNNDVTVADSLSQLQGQLAAAQYENSNLSVDLAIANSAISTLQDLREDLQEDLSSAKKRADVSTSISIAGLLAAVVTPKIREEASLPSLHKPKVKSWAQLNAQKGNK